MKFFFSPLCNVDISIRQDSALSSILSVLYLSLIFYIFEKHIKNLKIPISIFSFVDDGLFTSQHKSLSISNTNLFCSYNVISNFFTKFRLIIEHGKTEVFHFSRTQGIFNPSSLDLTSLGGFILIFKNI